MNTHVDTAQSLTHLVDHLAQQGKTSVKDVENWDTGSPSTKVVRKEPRTRDPNTMKDEENRLLKLELMKIPSVMMLFCIWYWSNIPGMRKEKGKLKQTDTKWAYMLRNTPCSCELYLHSEMEWTIDGCSDRKGFMFYTSQGFYLTSIVLKNKKLNLLCVVHLNVCGKIPQLNRVWFTIGHKTWNNLLHCHF